MGQYNLHHPSTAGASKAKLNVFGVQLGFGAGCKLTPSLQPLTR